MAAAAYTTDLATLNLSTGTWDEFTGAGAGSAPTENDSDNFIAGTNSTTEAVRNSGLSSMYAPANTTTITSGDAVFMWLYFASMPVMKTYANAGYSVAIGDTDADYYKWTVAGRDTLPYGGWFSVAVDPAQSATATIGSPSGTWTYFGSVIDLNTGVSKGNAYANDYQRQGRSLIVTLGDLSNGYAIFSGAAAVNDAVTARWGLFAEASGGYSQKGLFQFGSATTSVDFRDSNVNITIEDTTHCAAGFNEFEVLNTGSNVELTGIQISALGTQSPGLFTVTDNATVDITTCIFNDMGAFTFLSNTIIVATSFTRCGQVTMGGGTLDDSTITESTAAIALSTDDLEDLNSNNFIGDSTGHAVELTSIGTGTMAWDNTFDTTTYATSDGSTGNEAIYVNVGSGSLTINVASGATTPTIRTAGATVVVVAGAVTVEVIAKTTDGTNIQNVNVFLRASDDTGPFPYQESVTITNSGTTATVAHTGHGMATNDKVDIKGATNESEYNGVKQIIVTGVDAYTYVTAGSPASPAVGTIESTFVALEGLTDINGKKSTSRTYATNQPVTGWARKSTTSPYYRQAGINNTIDSSSGLSATVALILDE